MNLRKIYSYIKRKVSHVKLKLAGCLYTIDNHFNYLSVEIISFISKKFKKESPFFLPLLNGVSIQSPNINFIKCQR